MLFLCLHVAIDQQNEVKNVVEQPHGLKEWVYACLTLAFINAVALLNY